MKWKEGVTVRKQSENGYCLQMDGIETPVRPEHIAILKKIQSGEREDERLVSFIEAEERIPADAAGFTLAGFLIAYAAYVEADKGHYEIL